MAKNEIGEWVGGIIERLIELARQDDQLRSQLCGLAQSVADRLAVAPPRAPQPQSSHSDAMASESGVAGDRPHDAPTSNDAPAQVEQSTSSGNATLADRVPVDSAPISAETSERQPSESVSRSSRKWTELPELTFGRSEPIEPNGWSASGSPAVPSESELPLIVQRCRLKAEAARWASRRRRLICDESTSFAADIDPVDRDLIQRARELPDCVLWMCNSRAPQPSDPGDYDIVAHNFDVTAQALIQVQTMLEDWELYEAEFEESLDLLAEAQSGLRQSIQRMGGPSDWDQQKIYHWLRETASARQIFIQRHMRTSDPADPMDWKGRQSRIDHLEDAIEEKRHLKKLRRKWMGKVRHKASLIARQDSGYEHEARILADTVDRLVNELGIPPSNRELRQLLLPAIDFLPPLDDEPDGFRLVLREIDRFLSMNSSRSQVRLARPSPDIRKVARLLQGRSMILIAGDRRPEAASALEQAFELDELIWLETADHPSVNSFAPYVARPEVAVVVLAIRWSAHSHGDVSKFCREYEKPLVRLPAGYNPNQVAAQIVAQCSDRLEQSPEPLPQHSE